MDAYESVLNWATVILPNLTNIQKARHGDQSFVYHLEADSGKYVLKIAKNLEGEREHLTWLSGKTLVPEVVDFKSFEDTDALLMTELPGKNLASHKADWEPEAIVDRLAFAIRAFHSIDFSDCPFGSHGEGKFLVHGDACLPNFIFDGDRFSGYIDLGDMRIDYPEADLSAAVWSLQFNELGVGYGTRFLKAYGYHDSSEQEVERLRLQYEETQRAWGLL